MINKVLEIRSKLRQNALAADERNAFPAENIALLKELGLMGFLAPQKLGGYQGDLYEFVQIAEIISSSCLSTGMIWAMHCQQIACLVNHSSSEFKKCILSEIVKKNLFIGSVTSEVGNAGNLFSVSSPIEYRDEGVEINRFAPVVTGGEYCDGYLITMNNTQSHDQKDIKLIYASKEQLNVVLEAKWNSMGMRGTNSSALSVKGTVPVKQIINPHFSFEDIAYSTMIPIGHIVWSSCWIGAAKSALKEMIKIFKGLSQQKKFNLQSELFLEKIARMRLQLDLANALLSDLTRDYLKFNTENSTKLRSTGFLIKCNNLKVYSSESMFKLIDDLIELSGMKFGYTKNESCSLERVFRDIRAASLMINNNNLLIANGRLALFDKSF